MLGSRLLIARRVSGWMRTVSTGTSVAETMDGLLGSSEALLFGTGFGGNGIGMLRLDNFCDSTHKGFERVTLWDQIVMDSVQVIPSRSFCGCDLVIYRECRHTVYSPRPRIYACGQYNSTLELGKAYAHSHRPWGRPINEWLSKLYLCSSGFICMFCKP
jgi:hypothetical protein